MKLFAVAYRPFLAVGSVSALWELLMPATKMVWSEGPQLADWIEICADLIGRV